MRNAAIWLLLAGGGVALYRWRNPSPVFHSNERREVAGRTYFIRRGTAFYDVLDASGHTLVRVQTDTNRALSWAKTDAATQAIADLCIIRAA